MKFYRGEKFREKRLTCTENHGVKEEDTRINKREYDRFDL